MKLASVCVCVCVDTDTGRLLSAVSYIYKFMSLYCALCVYASPWTLKADLFKLHVGTP